MLTLTAHPTIERACTPIVWRALQRIGIFGACAVARHELRMTLGITPDLTTRGLHRHWQAFPLTVDHGPLATGPQLWSDHHE